MGGALKEHQAGAPSTAFADGSSKMCCVGLRIGRSLVSRRRAAETFSALAVVTTLVLGFGVASVVVSTVSAALGLGGSTLRSPCHRRDMPTPAFRDALLHSLALFDPDDRRKVY